MRLLDPGAPFLEIGALAAHGMYEDAIHSAGVITGVGRVMGREVMVVCNDSTIKGGTYYPMTVKSTCAPKRSRERTVCPASISWIRRRQPAASDRSLPRPRAFRPHLLQPGEPLRTRRAADRLRDGLLHGRRRLCAGHVGRDHHREEAGHHLPRRPAAREGRDRRGRVRRKISAAPMCMRANRASRTITPRTTCMRSPSRVASSARSTPRSRSTSISPSPSSRNMRPTTSTPSCPPT
jgi:hypothetical protein